jgi:hypothetical protein
LAAARTLFLPPGLRQEGQADADRAHAAILEKRYPLVMESMREEKLVAVTGLWPPDVDRKHDGGLWGTLEWLSEAGMLEWVKRSPPSL